MLRLQGVRTAQAMAPRLKLLDDFRVKTFWSSRNSYGVGKFGVFINTSSTVEGTHVFETRLEDSLPATNQRDSPYELTVTSPEPKTLKGRRKPRLIAVSKVAIGGASAPRKRQKTALATTTRRWQEVWACKYAWAQGEFNSNGDLVGVLCQCYSTISGRRKLMVPKDDNLEKHEGKRSCKEDGVPFPHLKKGDTYIKLDCKHL